MAGTVAFQAKGAQSLDDVIGRTLKAGTVIDNRTGPQAQAPLMQWPQSIQLQRRVYLAPKV